VVSFFLQTGGPGGFDLAGLLNNPGFMSMVNLDTDHSQAVPGLCIGLFGRKRSGAWRGELLCLFSRFVFISFLGFSVAEETVLVSHENQILEPVTYSQASPRNVLGVERVPVLHCQPCLVWCTVLLLAIFVLLICFQVFLPSLCLSLNGTTSADLPSHF